MTGPIRAGDARRRGWPLRVAGLWVLLGALLGGCTAAPPLPVILLNPTPLPTLVAPISPVAGLPSAAPQPDPAAPPATAGPVATIPVAAGTAVFALAWFHKPPEDGTSPAQLAATQRYIHLTGPSDHPYLLALRAAGYRGPIYTYTSAYGAEGPGPYKNASAACAPGYLPNDNNLAWQRDDFCTLIHPHESWFLHNGKGDRLVDDYFGSLRWTYLMNPADPGWQAFSYARLRTIQQTWGYDGVWLDNLDLDLERGLSEVKNSDGQVREYASPAAWQTAMQGWLAGARAQLGSWPIWANLVGGGLDASSWDAYAPYLDGTMAETFSVSWLSGWRDPASWTGEMDRADRWLAAGKGLVMVGQGPRDDTARLRFTLASYLLVAQGGNSFFRYTRFDTYYTNLWLYPEYDTARVLGAPLGSRSQVRPGVWRREFAHGYVEVDVAGHTGQVTLAQPPAPPAVRP